MQWRIYEGAEGAQPHPTQIKKTQLLKTVIFDEKYVLKKKNDEFLISLMV